MRKPVGEDMRSTDVHAESPSVSDACAQTAFVTVLGELTWRGG